MKEFKFLSLVMVAGAAALLTACTSESENGPSNNISYESIKAAEQVPVTFGTYMGDNAITRAGSTKGVISSDLSAGLKIGVFAYYTDDSDYDYNTSTGSQPNFMYNQLVSTADGSSWTYSPIKYWPNEFHNSSDSSTDGLPTGTSLHTGKDKLTFFAYAPYAAVTASTGAVTDADQIQENSTEVGITNLTSNSYKGNPSISYTCAQDPANSVDLLYANVVPAALINLTKQTTTGKVTFPFSHALARLGIEIAAVSNSTSYPGIAIADGTKIFVNSISITNNNLKDKGVFDLNTNSTTANASTGTKVVTSAWDTSAGSTLNFQIGGTGKTSDLNAQLVEGPTTTGVTNTLQSVFKNTSTDYLMLIPAASNTFIIVIDYDVITTDANLVGGKSTVNNVITNNITFDLVAGKAYKLNLYLGMTTVDITASVTDWVDAAAEEVWLPVNL